MRRGTRRLRIPAAALAIIALAAAVAVAVWAVGPGKAHWADVVAVALAAAAAAANVVAWAKRPQAAGTDPVADAPGFRAAQVLAGLVRRQWEEEARIRSLHDPEPIPVTWQLTADRSRMSPPRLISTQDQFAFTGRSDDIAALARDFRALKSRRLVITGGPGMGKTTLAVQLLLQLLATRAADQAAADAAGHGEIVPVPVLLPVSGWNLQAHPGLQEWLADRLAADYPALAAPELGRGAAAALVNSRHILPILDGLDEIGEQDRAEILAALNASLRSVDQLILTSRTTEFTTAVAARRPLTGAAVIVPTRLTPQAAADYLTLCLAANPPGAWQQVMHALRKDTAPGLTTIAQSPLGLWLIRAVYLTPGTDPAPLAGPLGSDAVALRAHLLDRLIPALIARDHTHTPSVDPAHPFRPRRRLDPDATRCYLTHLARAFPPAQRDIAWWSLAGTTSHARLVTGLVTGLTVGLTEGFWIGTIFTGVFAPSLMLTVGIVAGIVFGIVAGLNAARTWVDETPGYASLRRRGPLLRTIISNLAAGLAFWLVIVLGLGAGLAGGLSALFVLGLGLAFGLVKRAEQPTFTSTSTPRSTWRSDRTLTFLRMLIGGLVFGLTGGLVFWLAIGLARELTHEKVFEVADAHITDLSALFVVVFGLGLGTRLAFGLVKRAEQPTLTSTSTPRSTWRSDRTLTFLRMLIGGLVFGLTGGLGFGLLAWFTSGLSAGLMTALAGGLTTGLAFGPGLGVMFGGHHAWLACTIARVRLAKARRLPWRLMNFLDDAHRLGLLRAVGPLYQFRHAALHDHLAAAPSQGQSRA
ncbi:NACHT domain-containing protein [Nonomuraea wenchangensis]|uniref:NACHT domain-containing protein n=1 Tax=Nonomuraea wenchangensis TaxID=568860 RepID=UPI0033235031